MQQLDPCADELGQLLSFRFQDSPVGGDSSRHVGTYEYVALWTRHLRRRRNFSTTTTRSYRETLNAFGYWLTDHHAKFSTATPQHVEGWLDSRTLAASTRRLYLSRVRLFYVWMLDEDHAASDPTRRLTAPRVGRYLPRPAPAHRIYQNLSGNPRVAAMVALGAYVGMRRFEIAKLRGEDIDLTQIPPVVTVRGKGSVDRRVPLNVTVVTALRRHGLPPVGWVFPSDRGGPLSAQRCGRLIADALSTSDSRITAHQLRHWFGTTLYQGSGDIRMVQELLGHISMTTTQIYTAWDPRRASTAVAALPGPPEAA